MSNEIKCPHCGEAFTVDESGYAAILNQVRDQEFQREVDARVSLAEKSREQEVALAVTKAEEALRAQIAERDGARLPRRPSASRPRPRIFNWLPRTRNRNWRSRWRAWRAQLSSKDGEAEVARKLAVSDAVAAETERLRAVERERDELAQKLESERAQASMSTQIAVQRAEAAAKDAQVAVEREQGRFARQSGAGARRAGGAEDPRRGRAGRARAEAQAQLAEKLRAKDELIADRRAGDRAHPGHEGAPFHEDARRVAGTALRDRVQPPAPYGLPARLLREGQRGGGGHQGRLRLPRLRRGGQRDRLHHV